MQGIVELGGVHAFDTRVEEKGEEMSRLRYRMPFTWFSFEADRPLADIRHHGPVCGGVR